MIKYISFDLQGTLSNSNFSNNFWINILPTKYSKYYNLPLDISKDKLKKYFKTIGVYDLRYYDDKYWEKELNFNTLEELNKSIKPELNNKLINYISKINLPKIIISTTTNLFIDYELKDKKDLFIKTYSCVDYFKIGGKIKDIYDKIIEELKIKPDELLHIGDNYEMDYINAILSGVNAIYYNGNDDELIKQIESYIGE